MLSSSIMLDLNLGVYRDREIGPRQLFLNVIGALGDAGNDALDDTRRWRAEMWNVIIDYTVFGSYFWTGKGYGINIVDDAGFSLNTDPPTRAPHNSHLTFLARGGVPGFLAWVVLQLTWVFSMMRVLLLARRTGRPRTAGLMTVLLAYWTAVTVIAATAPFFEGPYDGIWFWTVFGFGAAAARMVRRDRNFFERMEFAASPDARGTGRIRAAVLSTTHKFV